MTAKHNPCALRKVVENSVSDRAAYVIEVDVDAVRRRIPNFHPQVVSSPIVDRPVVPQSIDDISCFLVGPDYSDSAAALPFGDLTDAQWGQMARFGNRVVEGGWTLGYDPGIAAAFSGPITDIDMWGLWESIDCPVLALRGQNSDLLSLETATEMTVRGPRATLETIPGCGHAPALMDHNQIALIRDWLRED